MRAYSYVDKIDPAYSSDDPTVARYRRMRDLNNEASRRCRLKKKRKVENHDHALQYEQVRPYSHETFLHTILR